MQYPHTNGKLHGRFFRLTASLSLIALLTPMTLADPPDIGPQVRTDPGGGTEAVNENSAAAVYVPGANLEIVTTGNDWRESNPSEIIRMSVGVSSDGGATWDDFLVRAPGPNQSSVEGDPMACYDHRTGTLWVGAISFSGNGGVFVARKNPGENTFQPSVMARATSGADKCWMAAGPAPNNPDQTRVYIAYNQGVLRSADMGQTWSGPVSIGSGIGFLPRVGPNGEVYVASWDFGNGVNLRRSFDGGVTFGPNIRIANRMDVWSTQDGSRFPGTFRVPSMNYLAVDPNTGVLYCVYFDTTNIINNNRNVDLYFTKSSDQGSTWTAPVIINTDANPPGDQFFPWLEVDDAGRLHMVFFDSRHTVQNDNTTNGMFDAYYAISTDAGDSWTEYRLTPNSFNSNNDGLNRSTQFMGDYLGLALAGDVCFPNYTSSQNGDTDMFVHRIVNRSLAMEQPSPGIAGQINTITTTNATPGQRIYFAYGTSHDPAPVPGCPGLSVFLGTPNVIGSAIADGTGTASIQRFVNGGAQGSTFYIQALERSSCTPSNLVITTFN